jgi:ATP-dependent DNA helicase RecQ
VGIIETRLLYISPEKLLTAEVLQTLQRIKISLFAIDEAHCISQWGHDFRPEYTRLRYIKQTFPLVPVGAFTATADKTTRQDILRQLSLRDPAIFVASFDRPNLSLTVKPVQDRFRQVVQFIQRRPGQVGIIYCMTRKSTETLTARLQQQGFSVACYHAGMPDEARAQVQDDFIYDRVPIICATLAFGMGIDKSNVRWVIHYHLPGSLESYYQEIGRAGRDGLPGDTLLLYTLADVLRRREIVAESPQRELLEAKLQRMEAYARAQVCRRRILLGYFGEHREVACGRCDVCLNPPVRFDGTILAQKALSAIARMRTHATMALVIDVLRGSSRKEITEKGLDQLKTYGVGSDLSAARWQYVILQLLHLGLAELSWEGGQVLTVTEAGRSVLLHDKKVELVRPPEPATAPPTTEKSVVRPYDTDLFEALRRMRTRIAREHELAPYLVLSDATLQEIARWFPQSHASLADISGIGVRKLEQYGDDILLTVHEYLARREKRPS